MSAPASGTALQHRYEGPSVAFDIPDGWHEFYLDISAEFFAAYGPVEGGDADFVAVMPVPPELAQSSREKILALLMPPPDRIGEVRVVDVNGVPGYSVSGRTGDDFEGEVTLVEGRLGDYAITCQSTQGMREEVARGCASIRASMDETDPSPATDPSGCMDRELSLLHDVPLPDGSLPKEPEFIDLGTSRGCDRWVSLAPNYRHDVIAILSERLTDAGWHPHRAKLDRTLGTFDVWQMVADRDWDLYQVEAYIDGGVTDHFFITVADG